jgi:ABC-type branched-subunit amino acid transport system ATPase component/ABC-type branched-subunit amino acid transport system permease subunit
MTAIALPSLQIRFRPQRLLVFAVVAFFALWPWTPLAPYSVLGDAVIAAQYCIVAVSLVVLIGWVGQISIAQAALVGVGAYSTGLVVNYLHVPFPANLPLAAAASGLVAATLGVVALRVRGLYLAVATLIFGYMCDEFLFRQPFFAGYGGQAVITQPVIGHAGAFPSFDLTDRRIFYYVVWAFALAAMYGAANLRSAKTGRAFFAMRGSEVAAASLGINVTRYKLLAFVLSGVLAGVAGNLIIVGQLSVTQDQFDLTTSLFFLSIAVVGGLTSLGGALAASLLFAGLNEAFFRIHALSGLIYVVSAGLLTVVLLTYPGGLGAVPALVRSRWDQLAGIGRRVRDALHLRTVLRRIARDRPDPAVAIDPALTAPVRLVLVQRVSSAARRVPRSLARLPRPRVRRSRRATPAPLPLPERIAVAEVAEGTAPARLDDAAQAAVEETLHIPHGASRPALDGNREDRAAFVDARGITVRFGGLVANEDVSFSVREGEIVGLIGPNGAGKTTLFNAVLGLNQPAAGTISLLGEDVTSWPVHERAQLGVARTFQAIQLFGQLTVFENLMVATHVHNRTGVLSHIVAAERSIRADLAARDRVRRVLELMELRDIAQRPVKGLPFGTLRMIEVARAIVTGARLVMLDEPASGLDNKETERLSDVLLYLRGTLGMTLLVIEHDVPFVTGVSDHMYVLNGGRLLAEGTPAQIQQNPEVVAAYLGTPSVSAMQVAQAVAAGGDDAHGGPMA